MVTRRSLNKLERKAYMNIHNTKDVSDESEKSSRYTKDRFGKKHEVLERDKNEKKSSH